MARWVWLASPGRLKHLALIQASAASRSFAWTNIIVLAIGLGLLQATHTGWRRVTDVSELEPTGSTRPSGGGWLKVVAAPEPLPADLPPETYVALWWNPAQALIALATGIVASVLLMWLVLLLIRVGVARVHKSPYGDERRMTAAIEYSTAWGPPLILAVLIACLRPLSLIGEMGRWGWYPPEGVLVLVASVVTVLVTAMWWFWLIRLGFTAPASTRGRVVAFFAVVAPLLLSAAGLLWWWVLARGQGDLFDLLRLSF